MKVERSVILPFSAEQMYTIVSDIEAYPDFLNWCDDAVIFNVKAQFVDARVDIAYRKLSVSFVTRNENIKNQAIKMDLVEGPFSRLSGVWLFHALSDNACKVSLSLDFDFDNAVMRKMFSKVFEQLIASQIQAFESRAKQLYVAS